VLQSPVFVTVTDNGTNQFPWTIDSVTLLVTVYHRTPRSSGGRENRIVSVTAVEWEPSRRARWRSRWPTPTNSSIPSKRLSSTATVCYSFWRLQLFCIYIISFLYWFRKSLMLIHFSTKMFLYFLFNYLKINLSITNYCKITCICQNWN